ncbi:MAG: sodium/solute symporter [Lachnospiraceae bacterium]|nr:sodium/solute symporter [Lachnospiraceae bacterium]
MLIPLTCALLVCFFALMIFVGFRCRKHATDVNGFVLGGRNVGPWLTAFAFGTSYFSAVIFVGYAGQFGWKFGLASTWIGLGNAFIGSLLAWEILGRRTRVMTRHLDTKTMPDFFEKRYNSKALKIVASIIVFVFLIPYTASLYNGLSSLFNIVFTIPYWVVIVIMAVLTAIYVIFGGYMATAVNDFIQGIIMLVGIVAVVLSVLISKGGLSEACATLSKESVEVAGGSTLNGAYTAFFGPSPLDLLFVVILTSLGTWGLPQMVGKFYSIKNEDAIKKGTIISTFFAIVVAGGCYFLGGFGRLFADSQYIGKKDGKILFDSIIPAMLRELPDLVIAIVIVLVLAASMSTLSSLVLTSSSTLTLDVIAPASKKEFTEKKKVLVMRIFIVFFVIVSAVIAVLKDRFNITFIAQMMGVSWGALAGAFLAPFLYGLYAKKVTKSAVATCFVYATGVTVVQLLVSFGAISFDGGVLEYIFRSSLNSGVCSMVGGLILVPIVSMITPKPDKDKVDAMFACYDQKVTTEVKMSERLEEK